MCEMDPAAASAVRAFCLDWRPHGIRYSAGGCLDTIQESNAARSSSSTATANGVENQPQPPVDAARRASQTSAAEMKLSAAATKSNPIGQASAFPWLKSGQPARALASGD